MTVDHDLQDDAPTGPSRRHVLRGTAVGAIAVPVLAACGADDGGSGGSGGSGDGDSGGSGGSGGSASGPLSSTSDVPVEGGAILSDEKIVVTQPRDGEFKAFTAVCTHQGCIVASVSNGTINCDCHGSKFSIEDGSVVNGPAGAPLEEVEINVDGDTITRA
jgi:Rieske Fe-S protein